MYLTVWSPSWIRWSLTYHSNAIRTRISINLHGSRRCLARPWRSKPFGRGPRKCFPTEGANPGWLHQRRGTALATKGPTRWQLRAIIGTSTHVVGAVFNSGVCRRCQWLSEAQSHWTSHADALNRKEGTFVPTSASGSGMAQLIIIDTPCLWPSW